MAHDTDSTTHTMQLTERVLGKTGSIGEIRTPGSTPGRRHIVAIDWRREGGQPVLAAVSCKVGGQDCQGFYYRRTCSHAEAALALVRVEREDFRQTRDIVSTGPEKRSTAGPLTTDLSNDDMVGLDDDAEIHAALSNIVASSRGV